MRTLGPAARFLTRPAGEGESKEIRKHWPFYKEKLKKIVGKTGKVHAQRDLEEPLLDAWRVIRNTEKSTRANLENIVGNDTYNLLDVIPQERIDALRNNSEGRKFLKYLDDASTVEGKPTNQFIEESLKTEKGRKALDSWFKKVDGLDSKLQELRRTVKDKDKLDQLSETARRVKEFSQSETGKGLDEISKMRGELDKLKKSLDEFDVEEGVVDAASKTKEGLTRRLRDKKAADTLSQAERDLEFVKKSMGQGGDAPGNKGLKRLQDLEIKIKNLKDYGEQGKGIDEVADSIAAVKDSIAQGKGDIQDRIGDVQAAIGRRKDQVGKVKRDSQQIAGQAGDAKSRMIEKLRNKKATRQIDKLQSDLGELILSPPKTADNFDGLWDKKQITGKNLLNLTYQFNRGKLPKETSDLTKDIVTGVGDDINKFFNARSPDYAKARVDYSNARQVADGARKKNLGRGLTPTSENPLGVQPNLLETFQNSLKKDSPSSLLDTLDKVGAPLTEQGPKGTRPLRAPVLDVLNKVKETPAGSGYIYPSKAGLAARVAPNLSEPADKWIGDRLYGKFHPRAGRGADALKWEPTPRFLKRPGERAKAAAKQGFDPTDPASWRDMAIWDLLTKQPIREGGKLLPPEGE